MKQAFDIIVAGAGPGGLAAAATAAECGKRVCLIDDNATPGGQIWRGGIAKYAKNAKAERWLQILRQHKATIRTGWRVVHADSSASCLTVECGGEWEELEYGSLILATGARELFLPFPGWTLPGVYGVGGLQAFVKSGLDISGKRIVVAGTGPLLLAVADGLRRAGAHIVAIVEQAPLSRLAGFSLSLMPAHFGKLIEGAGYAIRSSGTAFLAGRWVSEVTESRTARGITITNGASSQIIEADMLSIGYHLIPNTELAQLLHCNLEKGFVHVNALQETSVTGIYCVGEATGIGGVDKAQIEGRIAGLIAGGRQEEARRLYPSRDRQLVFARRLSNTFQLRPELRHLVDASTIVCRCEDISHGSLSACHSWREAKLQTRCGMGPCQGRICSPAAQFLYGWAQPNPRPPLFPVEIATLASFIEDAQEHLAGQQK